MPQVDDGGASHRQPHADKLQRSHEPDEERLIDSPHHARHRLPPRACRDEQRAGDPDIRGSFERTHEPRNRVTKRVARKHAVMQREQAEQDDVERDRDGARLAGELTSEHGDVAVGEVEERIREEDEAANRDRSRERLRNDTDPLHGRYYSDLMRPTSQPRVVISGIGVVSPFGAGRDCFWRNVSRGVSGTRAITQFDASSYPCRVAAAVPPVSVESAVPLDGDGESEGRADPKRYSRAALFGVIAGREAWRDAGLRAREPNAGVLIGSGGGGIDVGEKQYEDFFTSGGRHVTPYAIAVGICGMVSSEISISLGLHGISHVLSCG